MSVKNWFWNWFGLVENKTASASIPNAFPVGDAHESESNNLLVLHRGGAATQGGGGGGGGGGGMSGGGGNTSYSLFIQKEPVPKVIKESLEPKEETEAGVEEPKPILETVTTDQSIVEKPVKEKKAKRKPAKKEEPDEEEKLVNNKVISELERLQEYAKKKPIRLVMGTRRGDYIFLRFHEVKLIWMEVNPFNHRKRWKPVSDETIRSATAARRK